MPRDLIGRIAAGLQDGSLLPYLGPEVLPAAAPVPITTRDLCNALVTQVPVPRVVRENLWGAAQYIESHRHRSVLDGLLTRIFAPPLEPTPLHRLIARLRPPLVVDTWYDAAMSNALAGQSGWGQVQGITRANLQDQNRFFRSHAADGSIADDEAPNDWLTVLYKPIGAIWPAGNVLISDADYVEVLAEIDIQTPIPPVVQHRRTGRGFVFFGCRFYDQIQRAFARQVMKRSGGPAYAILPGDLTRNEQRFLELTGIERIDLPTAEAVTMLEEMVG